MNRDYAKLANGRIQYAPDMVKWTNEEGEVHTVNNPDSDKLLELGYLPVTCTSPPADVSEGQHYESHWEQTDTAIVQAWNLVNNPAYPEYTPEPTMQDLTEAIERGLTT